MRFYTEDLVVRKRYERRQEVQITHDRKTERARELDGLRELEYRSSSHQGRLEAIELDLKYLKSVLNSTLIDCKELKDILSKIFANQKSLELTQWPFEFYQINLVKIQSLIDEFASLFEKTNQLQEYFNKEFDHKKKSSLHEIEILETAKQKQTSLETNISIPDEILSYILLFLDTKSVAQAWVLVSLTTRISQLSSRKADVENIIYQTPLNKFVFLFSNNSYKSYLLLNQDNFQSKTSGQQLKLKHFNNSLRYLDLNKKSINTHALIRKKLEEKLYLEFKIDQIEEQDDKYNSQHLLY